MSDDLMQKVHSQVKREKVIDLTQKLVRINSEFEKDVTTNHQEIADFISREIEDMGFEVETIRHYPDYPVVIGRLRGTEGKPSLGFENMFNTVYIGDRSYWTFDPLGGIEKDGRIYGRGAANSKGGLASQLVAARAVKESGIKLKGDLLLIFYPGEGAGEFCLPWIMKNRPEVINADWYMSGGGRGDITKMQGGHIWLKVIVRGMMGHPGGGLKAINAIYKMNKLMPIIKNVDEWMTWEPEPEYADYLTRVKGIGKPHIEFTKIQGGYEVNMVPDYCELQLDIRLFPRQMPEKVLEELESLLAKIKEDDPELVTSIELIGAHKVPPEHWARVTEDDELVKTLFDVVPKYTGKKPEWRFGYGAGRPAFWTLGSKLVFCGIGKGGDSHAPDEWVDIDSLVQQSQLYSEIATRILI